MKTKKTPIGTSDFKEIINENCYFVDKSLFISDVVNGSKVLLYPRPRRFGKTLNLSMLRYFYDCSEDYSYLFRDLAISEDKNVMQEQGKHPVIFLTFKDIKNENFDLCIEAVRNIISQLYIDHRYLLESDLMIQQEKEVFYDIIAKKANQIELEFSIKKLGDLLNRYYGSKPVLLIDEYDMPIHSAFMNGFYDQFIGFISNLLSSCLKDNLNLEKAVLTGILRVAKESIFSGLNNLKVNSMLSKESSDKFGFTEQEVNKCLNDYQISKRFAEVKDWYDGYNFCGNEIYNPWSILNFVLDQQFKPFWVNTSGNELIRTLIQTAKPDIKKDLEILVEKGSVNKEINDNIVYSEVNQNDNSLWNFLLMSGYLRYDNYNYDEKAELYFADLRIPNKEVSSLFRNDVIRKWFHDTSGDHTIDSILSNLTNGDLDSFKYSFIDFCISSFSYFDVSGKEPEKFYHAFVLGMIISLRDQYLIKSNRESGYGRYDIMLIPKDISQRAIIFEFKRVNHHADEDFTTAFQDAKKQIIEKQYANELLALGIQNIVNVVAVFDKKEVKVEYF